MGIPNKKVTDLVSENYMYAAVLHHFGIPFYHYSEKTLEQACTERGLNLQWIIKSLESADENKEAIPLKDCPLDLVIEYLRHAHQIFMKEKLPYVAKLIQDLSLPVGGLKNKTLIRDLQLMFPLFVEDFIHHIHEEEDTLFNYILLLLNASKGKFVPAQLYFEMEKHSIQHFAFEHHTHDDEMRGIREITNNYDLGKSPSLHLQVIFAELKALEKDLQIHAKVEDEILFIKSIQLEKQVREMMIKKISLN